MLIKESTSKKNTGDLIKKAQNSFTMGLFERNEKNGLYQCKNESLNRFFMKLYNKYKGKLAKKDFIAECMSFSYMAILKFECENYECWKGILKGTNSKDIGKLITYIKKTVKNKIYEFVVNDDVKFTRGMVEGEKGQHIMLRLNLTSIDSYVNGDDGSKVALMDLLGSDSNLFAQYDGYCWNFFIKWFKQNKDRILTKTQIKFLDDLTLCYHEKGDNYTKDDVYEVTGTPSSKKNTKLKKIEARVLKIWEKENPMGKKTLLQMQKEEELVMWEGLMKIVYGDDVDLFGQNRLVSDWFVSHLDEEAVWKLVFDLLDDNECRNVVNAYKYKRLVIEYNILYKLFEAVEARIDELLAYEVQAVEFFKRDCEKGNWNLDAHLEYEQNLKIFREQPCFVYDLEGNFVRIEGMKAKRELNIIEMQPTGTEVLSKIV